METAIIQWMMKSRFQKVIGGRAHIVRLHVHDKHGTTCTAASRCKASCLTTATVQRGVSALRFMLCTLGIYGGMGFRV